MEIAERVGTPAKLIDDRTEQDDTWFANVNTVLVTAGASAPDDLVNDLVLSLAKRYSASVEQWDLEQESIEFRLPPSVARLLQDRNIDAPQSSAPVHLGDDLDTLLDAQAIDHRHVDLTVKQT